MGCDCDAEASTFDRADPGSALGAAYFRREAVRLPPSNHPSRDPRSSIGLTRSLRPLLLFSQMSFELVAHTLVGMFALAPPSNGNILRSSGIQLSKLLTDARTLVDRSLLAGG